MSDLVEFLRARLDEDASWALACTHKTGEMPQPLRADHRKVFSGGDVVAETRSATLAEHIARHDPARVLREVEAKRRIIELHGIVHRNIGWLEDGDDEYGEIPVCGLCVPKHSHYQRREDVPEGPCPTVRLLALPYADRTTARSGAHERLKI